jgi:hypothetical protein
MGKLTSDASHGLAASGQAQLLLMSQKNRQKFDHDQTRLH